MFINYFQDYIEYHKNFIADCKFDILKTLRSFYECLV
jgi:hypothetical protein